MVKGMGMVTRKQRGQGAQSEDRFLKGIPLVILLFQTYPSSALSSNPSVDSNSL